jgi:DNA-binding HxlR family transcriptional regulator
MGDRWSILVLLQLDEGGAIRFTALRNGIGDISQRMLAKTLRRLERDGFVSRKVHPTVPPQVVYSLTVLGRSFIKPLKELVDWAESNHERVRKARIKYVPPPRQTEL